MKLLFKIFGWICITLAGIIAIAVVGLQFISDEQYKAWIVSAASSATGRELKIDGEFSVQLGSQLIVLAEKVSFPNAKWGKRAEMITIDRLFLNLKLLPLLRGVVDVGLEIDKSDILLEKDKKGNGNWVFADSPSSVEQVPEPEVEGGSDIAGFPFKPYISNFEIKDLKLTFLAGPDGKDILTEIKSLKIHTDDKGIPLSLVATYQGVPVEFKGDLGQLADWHENRLTQVSLQGSFNKAQLAINGSVGPLFPQPNANIKLSFNAEDLSTFGAFTGTSLSQLKKLGALQLNGNIVFSDQALKLDAIDITLEKLGLAAQADGAINDLGSLSGVEAKIEVRLDSLSHLTPIAESELPKTGPWKLDVQATSKEINGGPVTISSRLMGEGITTQVNATIPDVLASGNINAKLSMDTESLSKFGVLLNKELPDDGPLKVTADISAQPGEYRVDSFLALLNHAKILADLSYTLPKESESGRAQLVGKMNIQDLDLNELFPPSKEDPEVVAEEVGGTVKTELEDEIEAEPTGKKLFSNEPLAVGWLQDYNIDLKLEADNLTLHTGFTVHGNFAVTLNDGLLKLGPLDFKGGKGGIGEGLIVLDARNPEAKLDIFMDFTDFVSPRYGGKFDLDIDLDGSGESMADLMGSLNGQLIAAVNDVELQESSMTKFGAGLFQNMNPLGNSTVMLECAVVRLDAVDGLVDFTKKIAAQTTEVTWYGSGEINLKTEELDLGIHPKPRKAISSLTNVGLAELIHIGGTLAEPKVGIDLKDVAVKYATYGAYISTGGLSFLAEKIFENRKANMDQCLQILSDAEKE